MFTDPAQFLHEQLASASPDLLRSMLTTFINTLMSTEADADADDGGDGAEGVAEPGRRAGRGQDRGTQGLPSYTTRRDVPACCQRWAW